MNLVDGRLLSTSECDPVLAGLEERIVATLSKGRLRPDVVIAACDKLANGLDEADYADVVESLGAPPALVRQYVAEARELFRAGALRDRLRRELGDGDNTAPLGTLLHVAAGNMDGLPAFSVLEGLLAGNINILKLPAQEGGLSVRLLSELISAEPALAEYIYVFDYSSRDLVNLSKLIAVADAVVVWGGDEAVTAFRSLAPPNTRLIEWGHKVSFGYATPRGLTDAGLAGFARNIVETGQGLCSSCQGLFLDTEDLDDVYALGQRFAAALEKEAASVPNSGFAAPTSLELYTAQLELPRTGGRVFRGQGVGVIARPDRFLEVAPAPRAPWVKALPQAEIVRVLHPHKNHLQTVGLLCADDERAELERLFFATGVVRVTTGERMSLAAPDLPHDGEYPLRRYVKVVSVL